MVNCRKSTNGLVYTDGFCDLSTKPAFQEACNMQPCKVALVFNLIIKFVESPAKGSVIYAGKMLRLSWHEILVLQKPKNLFQPKKCFPGAFMCRGGSLF